MPTSILFFRALRRSLLGALVLLPLLSWGQLSENFNTGSKGSYATGSVTLASGSWTLNNALLGNATNDKKNGSQSVRVQNSGGLGSLYTNFDTPGGAGTVTVYVANYGSDTGGAFAVDVSNDGGTTFTAYNSASTTVTGTLTAYTFAANVSGSVRIRVRMTAGSTRINVDDVSFTSAGPLLTPSPSSLTGFTYVAGSGPSAAQSFSLSGNNLTAGGGTITVSGSTDYEVSADNSTFGSSATVAYSGTSLAATTVYVRLKAGLTAGSYNSETIGIAGGGASSSVTASGTVAAAPSLTVTPGSLSGFSTTQGAASAYQTYSLGGSNLSSSVTVTAPGGYEVAQSAGTSTTNPGTFGGSLTVTSANATAGRTIYVRLAASATAGTYSGNVTNTSGSASASVAVSGTVNPPAPVLTPSPASLTGFSYQVGSGPSASQSFSLSGSYLTGAPGTITVTAPADYEVSSDNSSFGASATVPYSGATLAATPVYVRLKAGLAVGSYNNETVGIAGSGASSSVTVSGTVTVQAPVVSSFTPSSGSVGTSVSITGSNFSGVTAVSFNGTSATFTVNSATSITATVPSGATTGPIVVTNPGGPGSSSTSFTVTTATITVAPTALSGFSTTTGTPSAAQTYQVSGTDLNGTTLTVTPALSAIQVSLDGVAFSSSLSIPLGGSATLAPTTIYVRLSSASASSIASTIANANAGVTANVAVNGLVLAPLAAKRWTGGAGSNYWFDAANWEGGTVPTNGDDVVLDHRNVAGKYSVQLISSAGAATAVTVASLRIRPFAGDSILVVIPPANNVAAALTLTRSLAGDTALYVSNKGAVINRSGASSGSGLTPTGSNPTIFLLTGGSYYHRTARSNSAIVTNLSAAAGTESGNFFYRVPSGSQNYSISASSRTYGNLILENGFIATYSASGGSNLTINGSLIIGSNETFTSTLTGNILLGGNLVNNGNLLLNPASGSLNRRLVFQGTAPQVIQGTAFGDPATATSYFNQSAQLEIANPAGVTLQTPLLLSSVLTLTNGLLTTDTTNLLTLNTAATVGGGSASSFVNGPLARPVPVTSNAAGTYTGYQFPLGKGSAYRPLTLNVNTQSNAVTYVAEQLEGNPGQAGTDPTANDGATLTRVSRVRSFNITPYAGTTLTQPTGFQGTLTLSFNAADDQVTNAANLVVAKRADSSQPWANLGALGNAVSGSSNGFQTGLVVSGLFSSFSDFALASTNPDATVNPLPVQLTSFTASRTPQGPVALRWTTASEKNSASFEVQRSLDGRTFAAVARVQAAGSSAQARTYASRDTEAPAGPLYYRLRQLDQDGTATFSPTLALAAGPTDELTLAPNPAHDQLRLLAAPASRYTVRNALGQAVLTGTTAADTTTTLDVTGLPAGVYFFELHGAAGRVVRKLVKE